MKHLYLYLELSQPQMLAMVLAVTTPGFLQDGLPAFLDAV